jgi:UDP-N-acetylmuramoyl-tripeptide--D-alanyl-D-alanine ligase
LPSTNVALGLEFFVFSVITAFFFLFILLINFINLPIEKAISQWFMNDAKKKIQSMQGLKVIGVTITIRSKLNATHDIFIVEMGAKRSGDIKEICELVSPQYGLITSVGPQHLETFKSIGTIIKTKFELVDALPADGIAFLNMDNEIISSMPVTKDVVGYGINDKSQKYYAEDVNFNMNGMNFKVVKADTGESAVFTTKLLGYHNVSNILAATSVASELGMSMDDIAYAVRGLEPVAHRLEFKKQGDICIIWDAYNSNPEGAKSALEVLKSFDGLKRVLITPGMIELGEQEAELNKEFGKQAGGSCDYIILVGIGGA